MKRADETESEPTPRERFIADNISQPRFIMAMAYFHDQLFVLQQLVEKLQLRDNASTATRGELEMLNGITLMIHNKLEIIGEEFKALRQMDQFKEVAEHDWLQKRDKGDDQ